MRLALLVSLSLAACSERPAEAPRSVEGGNQPPKPSAAGAPIAIDGSSTVYPIMEAVAEEFQKANENQKVTIGVSGTGGGFKKLCAGEIAMAGASRPIKASEVEACKAAGIEFIELPVAYDGLTVAVSPKATWIDAITLAELKTMWEPEAQGKVKKWSDVRKGWPDAPLNLFGAGVDSGTYDYFTQAVVGKEHSSRGDYTSSEDDNVLVQGVSNDVNALGFFGYAYYDQNRDKLKVVPVDDGVADNGAGPITPSPETVRDGTYQPLSRPLFLYVAKSAAARQEVGSFIHFFMRSGASLVKEAGYIPLPDEAYAMTEKRYDAGITGSMFEGGSKVGMTVEKLLAAEHAAEPAVGTPTPAPVAGEAPAAGAPPAGGPPAGAPPAGGPPGGAPPAGAPAHP
jgi:phosphate transport system substrate-binding protein